MLIDFCLPAYNEEKILGENALKLFKYCLGQNYSFDWRLVLIINGSSDGSYTVAKKLADRNPGKILAENILEAGRGNSLKCYYKKSRADILIYMDIDLAVNLADIEKLLKEIIVNNYDLVIGSRLLADSKIKRSIFRELSSQGYNILSRLILHNHFSDLQCGFKAIKKQAFEKISPYLLDKKWFFDSEMVILASHLGLHVREIAVDWSENRYDERKSKVNVLRDSLKFLGNLIKLKFRLAGINRQQ